MKTDVTKQTRNHVSQSENMTKSNLEHAKILRFLCFYTLEDIKTAATPISLYFITFAADD